MFCSLYLSSIAVTGHYAHWRPAVNALRDAIAAAHKAPLNTPLVAFNNDQATTLADVQGVLEAALKRLQEWRGVRRQHDHTAARILARW